METTVSGGSVSNNHKRIDDHTRQSSLWSVPTPRFLLLEMPTLTSIHVYACVWTINLVRPWFRIDVHVYLEFYATIIEELRSLKTFALGAQQRIIRLFGYLRSIVYDVDKIYGFRSLVQWRFQYANEEESLGRKHCEDPPAVVERAQALISDDPRQSLRVLMDVVKPWMETMASLKAICFIRTVHQFIWII